MLRILAMVALVGCAEDPDKKADDGIDVVGSVSLIGRSGSADVNGIRAFGTNVDGRMGALISNNPDASCDNVAELLSGGGTVDPSDVYVPGTCHIWISVSDYDGGWSHSWTEGDEGYSKAVGSNVNCAMGDGDFELVDTANGPGYQWTGTWWQGSPTAYDFDFSGGDGENFELELRMTRYQGSLPLTGDLETVLAEGEISGGGTAKWCEAMEDADVF